MGVVQHLHFLLEFVVFVAEMTLFEDNNNSYDRRRVQTDSRPGLDRRRAETEVAGAGLSRRNTVDSDGDEGGPSCYCEYRPCGVKPSSTYSARACQARTGLGYSQVFAVGFPSIPTVSMLCLLL